MAKEETKLRQKASPENPEELGDLRRGRPAKSAAGLPAVTSSMKHAFRESGIGRAAASWIGLNQKNGFDCPSCAWPDPDGHRAKTEFCENGAKAVASEAANKNRCDAAFFEKWSVEELAAQSDHWHELQGRLTEPVVLREGASHYAPIDWDEAFCLVADELNALDSPDEAVFYTSGRTVNEAAFLYQLFVRLFGTNNLPDCSNMCHESSGAALKPTIGIGKGTVSLDDFEKAESIFIFGQNPGTNHPRMLSSLQVARRNGCSIIAVNPLKEAGLLGFAHPQEARGLLGMATPLTSQFLQVRLNGDMALLKGMQKAILAEEEARPGKVLDPSFMENHTTGFEEWKKAIGGVSWDEVVAQSGLTREEIEAAARTYWESKSVISCWAMGLTQHKTAVACIQEVVNLHLLCGNLGKPGAGLCPVRGHSNVQGDRTMGIATSMPSSFLDALGKEFGFAPPRETGMDTVESIRAMGVGSAKVFFALGGNFLSATPDVQAVAEGLQKCSLTVQVSTKLNRSHLVTGKQALILPCLGRSEKDHDQFVTVENSMGIVHSSRGTLSPISDSVRSEPAIVSGLAKATLGDKGNIPWDIFAKDYSSIRSRIEKVVPGFDDFEKRVGEPSGFYLPNNAKKRVFADGKSKVPFTIHPLEPIPLEGDQLLLMTIRSHDQFNTTIYGMDDRYRGIKNERRVLFLNAQDMATRELSPEQPVNITSHWKGETREARLFLAIPYDIPKGCAAAYFPETNVLVPLDSTARKSNTPTSKSIVITVDPLD
ncbi:MAG: FdhF/YdeP family oxidoreductase [Opitutae bacterium]|nr:FdhF/YdeP family oxidoreductase [Opitutae bacterium]